MARIKGKPIRVAIVSVKESFSIGKRGLSITIRNAHGGKKLGTCNINVGGITWRRDYGKKKTYKLTWTDIEEG